MKKMNLLALALTVIAGLATHNAFALLPPEALVDNELKAVFATDGCVNVHNVTTTHVIRIDVCTNSQAQALADLLKPNNLGALVEVFGPSGTRFFPAPLPATRGGLIDLFNTAFAGNCLFIQAFRGEILGHDVVFVEIAKAVVQFFGDNLNDPNGNISELAAQAFDEKLIANPRFSIFTSADFISGCGAGEVGGKKKTPRRD